MRARRRCFSFLALALALFSWAQPALALSGFVLIWDAPAECPSAEVVRRAILERVGDANRRAKLRIRATVRREAASFRVQLQTLRQGQRGTRELQANTCEALVDAISIIVALAVDPSAQELEVESEREGAARGSSADGAAERSTESRNHAGAAHRRAAGRSLTRNRRRSAEGAVASDAFEDPVHPAAPRRRTLRSAPPVESASEPIDTSQPASREFTDLGLQVIASVAGAVESGLLPGLGFGLTARVGGRLRRFRVEAALSRWLVRTAPSDTPGKGAEIAGTALTTWGCFRAVPAHTAPVPGLRSALPPDDSPAIEAGPCIGIELGRLNATSVGVRDPGSGGSGYVATGGALRLGATASEWLSLDVRVEALTPLNRPAFEVSGLGVVHRPSGWSTRASLGVEAHFP